MALKYIVTGTGGCGTKSVAMLFHHAGLASGHEEIFQYDGLMPDLNDKSYRIEVESSFMAAPFLDRLPQDIKIIHLVRHPMHTVESLCDANWFGAESMAGYSLFIHNSLQTLHDYDGWDKYVHYVVEWNKMIEPYAHLRHRLELDDPASLLCWCGVNPEELRWEKHHASGREHPQIHFSYVQSHLWNELIEMTERYGYDPCE